MSEEHLYLDACQPEQIARRVATIGVAKAEAGILILLVLADAAQNPIVASAGNIVGGTLLVAGVYWPTHLRNDNAAGGAG
jgi:hypothetical protein